MIDNSAFTSSHAASGLAMLQHLFPELTCKVGEARLQKAAAILATPGAIQQIGPRTYQVTGSQPYTVTPAVGRPSCSCPDSRSDRPCKHRLAVAMFEHYSRFVRDINTQRIQAHCLAETHWHDYQLACDRLVEEGDYLAIDRMAETCRAFDQLAGRLDDFYWSITPAPFDTEKAIS